jgi:hypothetical protein
LPKNQVVVLDCAAAPRVQLYVGNRCLKPRCPARGSALNFVNNFAGLSVELLDELKEAASPAVAALGDDERADIDELVKTLSGNLEKIAEHGRRADGIVTSMLFHSRGGSGERRQVDLNALVDEALNLAYHGARAHDQGFDIVLERDFDSTACPIELVPQNMTRVLLNLIGNGFYAATSKCRAVGNGMRPRSGTNLFQPFFTTKPTGEGAGLGLSADGWIVTGYVFVWQIALTKCRATRPRGSPGLAQTLAPLAGNRGFESAPLQG